VLKESLADSARRLPGFRKDCEAVAALLDRGARTEGSTKFVDLEFGKRQQLVARLLQNNPSGVSLRGSAKQPTTEPQQITGIQGVTQTLIHGFYVSRYGWISMGYTRGRGECSDLTDFQFPPKPA
jgi:hypothetical protein